MNTYIYKLYNSNYIIVTTALIELYSKNKEKSREVKKKCT